MNPLEEALLERFPLLTRLQIMEDGSPEAARLPCFLGLPLAAAASRSTDSVLLLVPEARRVGFLTTILLAFSRLKQDFPELVKGYARAGLKAGQRVQVLPTRHVYEYAGVVSGVEHLFRLNIIGAEGRRTRAARSLPVAEALRLEPTDRKTPQGAGTTPLGSFELCALDGLLEVATGGNKSLFRSYVLYLTPRSEFEVDLRALSFLRANIGAYRGPSGGRLEDMLPWGWVTQDGRIEPVDQYQNAGQPLVAVSFHLDALAAACEKLPPFSVTVVVDDPIRLVNNLQAHDRIARAQKLVLLCGRASAERLQSLIERGCKLWRLSADELLLPGSSSPGSGIEEASYIGTLCRAIENQARLQVAIYECSEANLRAAIEQFERARKEVEATQDAHLDRLVRRLLVAILQTADLWTDPGDAIRAEILAALGEARRELAAYRMWYADLVAELEAICTRLKTVLLNPQNLGTVKREKLAEVLRNLEARRAIKVLAVTRSVPGADTLSLVSGGSPIQVTVVPIQNASEAQPADALIVGSWPNAVRFGGLMDRNLAADVHLILYDFEARWYAQYVQRETRFFSREVAVPAEKARLSGLDPRLLGGIQSPTLQDLHPASGDDADERAGFDVDSLLASGRKGGSVQATARQESRAARYVSFSGRTYAYLTEWHVVPTLVTRGDGPAGSKAAVAMRTVPRLRAGDIAVFRESGDSDVIRSIAESVVGAQMYDAIRSRAARWKDAVLRIGEDPWHVRRILREHGLQRAGQTVRNWIYDSEQIGPGEFEDLRCVIRTSGDTALEAQIESIWDAIVRLRALHRDAGARLTTLLLKEIAAGAASTSAHEQCVELAFGKVWIVRVEEVASEFEQIPSTQVNRLLWDRAQGSLW